MIENLKVAALILASTLGGMGVGVLIFMVAVTQEAPPLCEQGSSAALLTNCRVVR